MSNFRTISVKKLYTAVAKYLRNWHNPGVADELMAQLLVVYEAHKQGANDNSSSLGLTAKTALLTAMKELESYNPEYAFLLRYRYIEGDTVLMTARKLGLTEDQTKKRQREALKALTEVIYQQEKDVRANHLRQMESSLAARRYSRLFGATDPLKTLAEALAPTAPWVVSMVGLGGIGKTALADAASRQLIHRFNYDRIIWIQAGASDATSVSNQKSIIDQLVVNVQVSLQHHQPPTEPKLRLYQTLKIAPHLVIIDDIAASDETADLIAYLTYLSEPSQFLLLSRRRNIFQTRTYCMVVPELSEEHALALIRDHARAINLDGLAKADRSYLQLIYKAVGGIPLALRSIVEAATVYPLMQVISDLTQAQLPQIKEMYMSIYGKAWATVSSEAKILLPEIPLLKEGSFQPNQIIHKTGLTEVQLWAAIHELVDHSLIEVRGSMWERHYGTHPLTRAFLQTQLPHSAGC